MDLKLISIICLSIIAVCGFISAMINSQSNKALTSSLDEYEVDLDKCSQTISRKEKEIVACNDQIAELHSKLSTSNLLLHNKDVEIAELEGKLSAISRTNTKLLKEVSDDITVNVKAGDDAPVVVQKPKRRKPYKKRKPNAGSTPNNNKTGEKK